MTFIVTDSISGIVTSLDCLQPLWLSSCPPGHSLHLVSLVIRELTPASGHQAQAINALRDPPHPCVSPSAETFTPAIPAFLVNAACCLAHGRRLRWTSWCRSLGRGRNQREGGHARIYRISPGVVPFQGARDEKGASSVCLSVQL